MAVAESVATTGSPEGEGLNITLNDRTIPLSKMESLSPRVKRISIPLDQMGVQEGQRETLTVRLSHSLGKPVHLTARLEYKEKLTPATRAPISKGMSIERKLVNLDGKKLHPESIQLGDVVKVRLRVRTDESRNYIAIDDKLPAGFEALNAALANNQTVTSSAMSQAAKRGLRFLSHHELRDERVVFFVDKMPQGTLEFEYLVRATTAGTYTRPAATVEAMYDPTAVASTAIDTVTIQ